MASSKERKVGGRYKCLWCEKTFKAKRVTQYHCSEECAMRFGQTLTKKTKGRRTIIRRLAASFGFASFAELVFHCKMDQQGYIERTKYEPESFEWQPKIRSYTPDWEVVTPSGKKFYLEFKGKLDNETRSLLLGIKYSRPDLDLRIVLEKPKNKINPTSKTRYYQWCENNSFPWTTQEIGIREEWMEE